LNKIPKRQLNCYSTIRNDY